MKSLHLAIFDRDDEDFPPPLFCGPEANQPRAKVTLPDGAAIDGAWLTDIPNLAALGTLLDDLSRGGRYVIVHPGQGRSSRDRRKVLVLEVVDPTKGGT